MIRGCLNLGSLFYKAYCMRTFKYLVAIVSVLLAVTTCAHSREDSSSIFVSYFSSTSMVPNQQGDFDSSTPLSESYLKSTLCPGANTIYCRSLWLISHVLLNDVGHPIGLQIDAGSGMPYPPDKFLYKP
ncbi:hypothetical protein GGD38_006403 [Chitinophagaceae bacterium OAS944]|nr:hypothetical protein [Chitinophagaceae bacterium OAS944]